MTIIQIILIVCGAITVIAFLFAIIMSVNGHSFSRIYWDQIGSDFKRIY